MNKKYITPSLVKFFQEGAWVVFTDYVALGGLFLATVLINRNYGIEDLGDFNFYYAIAQILILSFSAAFSAVLRREMSLHHQSNPVLIQNTNKLKALCALGALLIVLAAFPFFKDLLLPLAVFTIAKSIDALTETYYTASQSLQRYRLYTLLKIISTLLFIAAVTACCLLKAPIVVLYISILGGSVIGYLFSWISFKRINQSDTTVHSGGDHFGTAFLMKESWALILNHIFFQLSSRLNVILIYVISSPAQAAVFSSGLIGVNLFAAVANSLGIVIFPDLTRQFAISPRAFLQKLNNFILLFFGMGLIVALIAFATIPLQLRIFGDMPNHAFALFGFLSLAIPFQFCTSAAGYSFVIIKEQKKGLIVTFGVVLFNLIFFSLFTKLFPTLGPAWAYVASSICQFLLIYAALRYFMSRKLNPDPSQAL